MTTSDHTAAIVVEVLREREAQNEKWGEQNITPAHWHLVLAEEFGEVSKELTKSEVPPAEDSNRLYRLLRARIELVQVAAVAVAMIESLDRNEIRSSAITRLPRVAGQMKPIDTRLPRVAGQMKPIDLIEPGDSLDKARSRLRDLERNEPS